MDTQAKWQWRYCYDMTAMHQISFAEVAGSWSLTKHMLDWQAQYCLSTLCQLMSNADAEVSSALSTQELVASSWTS